MKCVILLIGYFWLTLGVSTIIFVKPIRKYYGIFIRGNHPKSMGALAILVGSLLICAITSTKWFVAVFILGIIQVIKGLYLMFAPEKKVKSLIDWWLRSSIPIYMGWGIITMIMGLILIKSLLQ